MSADLTPLAAAYEDVFADDANRAAAIAVDALAILCREYGATRLARRLFEANFDLDTETSAILNMLLADDIDCQLPRRRGVVIASVTAAWTRAIAALAVLVTSRQAKRRHMRERVEALGLRARYAVSLTERGA